VTLLERNKLVLFVFKKQNVNKLAKKGVVKFGGQMKLIRLRMRLSITVEG